MNGHKCDAVDSLARLCWWVIKTGKPQNGFPAHLDFERTRAAANLWPPWPQVPLRDRLSQIFKQGLAWTGICRNWRFLIRDLFYSPMTEMKDSFPSNASFSSGASRRGQKTMEDAASSRSSDLRNRSCGLERKGPRPFMHPFETYRVYQRPAFVNLRLKAMHPLRREWNKALAFLFGKLYPDAVFFCTII